ncbi:MAG: serine O-acetyltransferase EpsC [Clostridiales bacterium]
MDNTKYGHFNELVAGVINELAENADEHMIHPNHLPDRNEVIEIIDMLREILFPGFYRKLSTAKAGLNYYIGLLLYAVQDKLQQQLCLALLHGHAESNGCTPEIEKQARQITRDFIAKLPALRKTLYMDVDAALDGDPAARSKQEIIFAYPGIYAITVYRIAHEFFLLGVPLIPRIMTEYAHGLTGIDIHPGAAIGHHFFIDHGTGIVVGETTEIGNHVKIYQGVTLGALSTRGGQGLRGKKRHPTIEDEVTIYSSTSILGGETVIGKGAVIGSNAFITKSVPPGTRVSIKTPELDFKEMKMPE